MADTPMTKQRKARTAHGNEVRRAKPYPEAPTACLPRDDDNVFYSVTTRQSEFPQFISPVYSLNSRGMKLRSVYKMGLGTDYKLYVHLSRRLVVNKGTSRLAIDNKSGETDQYITLDETALENLFACAALLRSDLQVLREQFDTEVGSVRSGAEDDDDESIQDKDDGSDQSDDGSKAPAKRSSRRGSGAGGKFKRAGYNGPKLRGGNAGQRFKKFQQARNSK